MAIRILGLNDDNHATQFYSEDMTLANYSGSDIIRFLGQGHSVNYDVRSVYICDMPEGEIFEQAFDAVQEEVNYMDYRKAFNILWAISDTNIYL